MCSYRFVTHSVTPLVTGMQVTTSGGMVTIFLYVNGLGNKAEKVVRENNKFLKEVWVLYPITSRFLQQESFRQNKHLGIDFAMNDHTPLRSIQPGEILKVVDYGNANVGKAVFVKWHDGKIAIYGHMSEITCRQGEKVGINDLLGFSGNSGHVMGANGGYHLHFAVKENGQFIDPAPYASAIQKMNNAGELNGWIQQPDIIQKPYSLGELFQGQMSIYQDLFQTLKMHFIHAAGSIDYSVFMQYVKYLLQFFS